MENTITVHTDIGPFEFPITYCDFDCDFSEIREASDEVVATISLSARASEQTIIIDGEEYVTSVSIYRYCETTKFEGLSQFFTEMDTLPGESTAYVLDHDEFANIEVIHYEILPESFRLHMRGEMTGFAVGDGRYIQIEIKVQMPLIGDLQYGFRL